MVTRTIGTGTYASAYTFAPDGYTVINLGTVSVASPIALDFTGAADTLINAGGITGANYAVLFAAGSANRLIANPGASFSGTVSGGNVPGKGAISTMELASGASTGTIGGLGSRYIDFAQINVDPGANWALSGVNTLPAGVTLTNAGTLSGTGITLAAGASLYQNTAGASLTNLTGNAVYATGAVTMSNDGLISGTTAGVYLKAGGTLNNALPGASITGTIAILAAAVATVTNSGIISAAPPPSGQSGSPAILLQGGGAVTNQAGGSITGGITASGPVGPGQPVTTSADGISIAGGAGTVVNAGTISGDTFAVTLAAGYANLVQLQPGGVFNGVVDGGNTAVSKLSSTLELTSAASIGTLGNPAGYVDFARLSIDGGAGWVVRSLPVPAQTILANAGTLSGMAGAAGTGGLAFGQAGNAGSPGSVAVQFASGASLSNKGAIIGGGGGSGETGGAGSKSAGPITQAGSGGAGGAGAAAITIQSSIRNTGSLTGGVGGAGGSGGLWSNNGSSYGAGGGKGGAGGPGASLGGNTAFLVNQGMIAGGAGGQGGQVSAPFAGSTGQTKDALGGNGGSGIYASDGGTVVNYGIVIGAAGGAGGAGLPGSGTNGPSGKGGAGVSISGGTAVVTNATGGTISGSKGADALLFSNDQPGLVVIQPGAVFSGAVDGGGASTLELASGASTGTLTGGIGSQYIGFSQLLIDSGAQWSMTAGGDLTGIVLTDSGTMTNAATLQNNASQTGYGVTLATGGSLTNLGTILGGVDNAVSGRTGTIAVTNYGVLTGNAAAATGVYLQGGGSVTNQQAGIISGLYGVGGGAPITVVNDGQITGRSLGAGIRFADGGLVTNLSDGVIADKSNGAIGIYGTGAPLTIMNFGAINGGVSGGKGLSGVSLAAGGEVVNFYGANISGQTAIRSSGGPATIVNYGGLKASGAYGVQFGAGYASLLRLHPGSGIGGTVSGGNTVGAAVISTLELAANLTPGTGTLDGLGSRYINFGQITVDSGASWEWTGTNTAAYGVTMMDSGALTNNSTLTIGAGAAGTAGLNLAAVPVNSNGGAGQQGGSALYVAPTGNLTNLVLIAGGAGGAGGDGTNGKDVVTGVSGYGGAGGPGVNAVAIAGGGAATNNGTLTGGAGGAGGDGAAGNVGGNGGAGAAGVSLTGGRLTNATMITGGAGGTAGNAGSGFPDPAGATGGAGGAGVAGTTGVVINNGTIDGASGGAGGTGSSPAVVGPPGANGVGVSFSGGGTVTNTGVIAGANGADAIDFGSGTSRLIWAPGATFTGLVNGGNTNGLARSTLELGTATSAGALPIEGVLAGLGTEFVNFAQIQVDAGAFWNMASGDSFAANATIDDEGTLLDSGQTVAGGGAVTIASSSGITASETVTAGGVWSGMLALMVGKAGAGSFLVSNGGTAGAANVNVAANTGGSGTISVTGTQSVLSVTGKFFVGTAGAGELGVQAGGTVTANGVLAIGVSPGADGSSVNVSGAGSTLQVAALLNAGISGSAGLSISDGASVTAGTMDAGVSAAAAADIEVSNANFTVTGTATVADDGTGVMSVLSGATFSAADLTIGSQGDSSGALVVSGQGSVVNVSGDLNVGTALGTGDLTIGPGAVVNALVVNLQGEVVLENGELDPTVNLINQGQTAGGSGTIAAGDIVDEGVIQAGGSKPSQKLLVVAGTILGGGPWTINGTAQFQANGDVGILQINAGGTMELTGPVLNAASTSFTDDVTPQSTYTVSDSVVDVNFEDAAGVLKLDDIGGFAGTVAAVRNGDSFVIAGGTLSNLGVSNNNTLTVSDSGDGGTDQIIFASAISTSGFTIVNSNTIQVVCFAAGTRIATETGPVAVEDLHVGDDIRTFLGAPGQIVWVGSRAVDCARHPRPETVWPIRIACGAFGENLPGRDLFVSPDHAIYVDGMLIPAKYLVNGTTIRQMKRRQVIYYHIELERHDVVLAEGLPAESYLDTGDRAKFSGGRMTSLYPDFSARMWEAAGCAPLIVTGPALEKVRQRIVEWAVTPRQRNATATPLAVRPGPIRE